MISSTPAPNPAHRSPQDHSSFFRRLSHLRETQAKNPPHPRRARRIKLFLRALLVLLVLVILGLIVFTISLRHSMRAALPQLDGELHVAGLTSPVTVTRDPQGVPSITAANLDDLLFSQGYVTASDRLFQMDALRRHAAGTLAEVLGPNLVAHDRLQRTLQIRAAADRALAVLPPDQLHQLSAYAAGVNAYITSHASTLPVEFHLLHFTPAPWTPRDSLLVVLAMSQDLSTEFPQKLNREALSNHLPANLLSDLYPSGSWRDVPPGSTSDITAPKDVLQIPLDKSQSKLELPTDSCITAGCPTLTTASSSLARVGHETSKSTTNELLSTYASLTHSNCDSCRSGSNNWAVSSARSATGGPLLSNDMHLGLLVPSTWYEAALHTHADQTSSSSPAVREGLDVIGFTLPGVPFVIVGRNAHVAWGFTAALADVQDLRIEHLRGTGKDQEFQLPNGSWAPVQHHPETIHVRFGLDKTIDVLTTTHAVGATSIETPLLNPILTSEQRAISLAWNVYDPANVTIPGLDIDSAANGAGLVAALSGFGIPSLSVVYADDANHIGFHLLGRIPIRGPATQRPRVTPTFILPDADPDEDNQDETDTPPETPKASLTVPFAPSFDGPHLQRAAYVRPTRAVRHSARPQPKSRVPHPRRGTIADRVGRPQKPAAKIPTTASPDEQTIAPAPATLYTIGSPISPIPVDSLDASQAWSGYVPYAELPSAVDPASGILTTANARVTTDTYPYFIANDWGDPYRAERIHHQLSAHSNLTPADLLNLQNDVHSDLDVLVAQRSAYALDRVLARTKYGDAKRLHQAADLLRRWDGNVSPNSPGAAIAVSTRNELWPILLAAQIHTYDSSHNPTASGQPAPAVTTRSQIGNPPADQPGSPVRRNEDPNHLALLYTWNERNFALEQLLEHTPSRWLPSNLKSWDDLLALAVEQALQNAHAPSDLSRFTYGATHPVEIAHPIFGSQTFLSKLLGVPTGTGLHPNGGDGTTVKQTGLHFGPSQRFTADLVHPDSTFGNITTGQSGNPASPWFLDQFLPWLNGTTFPLPLHYPQPTHTLTLTP